MTKKEVEAIVDRFAEIRGAASYQELSESLGLHPQTAYGWTKRASAPVAIIMETCTPEEAVYVLFGARLVEMTKEPPPPPPRVAEPEAGYHDTRIEELERELLVARTEAQTLRVINQQLIDGLAKPAAAPRHHHTRTAADEATR